MNYYNEFDGRAAAWLRELIADGLIASGEVDERSIVDVQPSDLRGFDQCHFFAGIGGWPFALRLAGWPDDRPVWTGSCPCQPFSAAGKGEGFEDSRHLWPAWFRLIRECRPPVVFGEQVASADGLAWFDTVSTDLEEEGYAVGAADLCAAGIGAPHIRQRLYFTGRVANAKGRDGEVSVRERRQVKEVPEPRGRGGLDRGMADGDGSRRGEGRSGEASGGRDTARVEPSGLRAADWLAHSYGGQSRHGDVQRSGEHGRLAQDGGAVDGMEHSPSYGRIEGRAESERGSVAALDGSRPLDRQPRTRSGRQEPPRGSGVSLGLGDTDEPGSQRRSLQSRERGSERAARTTGVDFWSDLLWLPCTDGKYRPTKPGLQPLAHGVSGRVGLLRGAGNAIVPELAAAFIKACDGD